MATFQGVVVRMAATPILWEKLHPLGVVATDSAPEGAGCFIEVVGSSWDEANALAQRVSANVDVDALALSGQTNVDVYSVAEFSRGQLVRRILFNRDGGGWVDSEGSPRGWESELHFAATLESLLDDLAEHDAPETDLVAAREAYEKRDLGRLPRLPAPSGSSMHVFLRSLGGDLSRPHARYRKPGWIGRLFGER
jgi:hypothetical protein